MKIVRFVINIISIILFPVMMFEACSISFLDTLSTMRNVSFDSGFVTAFLLLVAGIVGLVTRNSENEMNGCLIAGALYILGAVINYSLIENYSSYLIWMIIFLISGVVFLISYYILKKQTGEIND